MSSKVNGDKTAYSNTRRAQTLSGSLGKRVLAYAAVAGAGVASCASVAEAEVVYTPVHSFIDLHARIDLNQDGINDFILSSYVGSSAGEVRVKPLVTGNKIAAGTQSCNYYGEGAAALPEKTVIGPGLTFQAKASCMAASFSFVQQGAWLQVKSAYLGLSFLINGETHYGWARMHVSHDFYSCGCIGAIDGYAYETVEGKPIVAGDTGDVTEASGESATLGVLALGAPGLRRR